MFAPVFSFGNSVRFVLPKTFTFPCVTLHEMPSRTTVPVSPVIVVPKTVTVPEMFATVTLHGVCLFPLTVIDPDELSVTVSSAP